MAIATWNINSLRLRLDQVARLVESRAIDVLCLQEIKARPDHVPTAALAEMGLVHQALHTMPGYNGVGIFSRLPLEDSTPFDWCDRVDCRHLRTRVAGFTLHCLYIPAGGDIPDPEENPRFRHKLAFFDALTDWFDRTLDPDMPAMVVGDFNVAPLETDVWDHRKMRGVVSHTPVEVAKLGALQASGPWIDAMRRFVPPEEKLFTWWSYRAKDWRLTNRGRRLDHIWVTPALVDRLRGLEVMDDTRDWTPPSDHVPVIVHIDPPTKG
ncbi:exodeoxyribonuclease III [Rhodospirillum rubrum]|uniref:exodeoxyribonuclease III n=1 Tax=Rhodospirillum rubrum TaxID=1085 RepID=UPI0005A745FF|nr:exodeoxyribonuclease III [Rhodospirillum rubrum]QXG82474.1 exodeoxyribonuclease III [Rhodospirillum rubrum]